MARGGRAAPPAAAEDVATRVTLNHVLGNLGGRQKSWMNPGMVSGTPPIPASHLPTDVPRKRGRPRQYPEEYADAEPRQAPMQGAARDEPASNSTSPQLANVLSHPPNGRPLPSPTAVLPSPSPSEDTNLHYHTIVSHAPAHARQSMGDDQQAGHISLDESCLEGARQEATAPKRPAAGPSPLLANKRTRPSIAPRPLRTSSVYIDQQGMGRRVSAGQTQSESPTVHQPYSPGFGQSSNSQSPYRSQQQMSLQQFSAPQRVPSQAYVNAPTPPVSSTRQVSLTSEARLGNSQATRDNPTVPMHLQTHILQELSRFHSMVQPDSSDRKRLEALERAAKQMDWDYLITHLFYCLLSLDRKALPDSIKKSKHASRTEHFLREVLNSNHDLNPATRTFFIRFPVPLHDWAKLNPSQFHTDVNNFNDLMNRSDRYFELKNLCNERNLPPSMHELADDLGIRSRQLQTIVFTAAVRRLWFQQGLPRGDILNQYEHEALMCFSSIQETFHRRRSQVHDLEHERKLEMRYWAESFRAIYQVPVLESNYPTTSLPHPQQPQRTLSGQNHRPSLAQPHAAVQLGPEQSLGRPLSGIQPPRPQLQPQSQLQRQPRRLLIPPPGHHEPQQHMPNPARFALHQAHLRSPTLHSKTKERLYLYVQDFVVRPRRLVDARNRVEKWTFTLSPEQMATIPQNDTGEARGLQVRVIDENSSMIRLRCVKWNPTQDFDPHRWATSDTSWIPYSFFQLNSKPLEQRKKLHYGKDLPIDLTSLVKEGENVLEMSLIRAPENHNFRNYLIAIEILGVRSHDALMQNILTEQHIPAATTKQRIMDKLAGTGTTDDEIAVINSTLNITLFDPFSLSEICKIPARSRACAHFDCFDLETFLSTRKRNADSTVPDGWKCPICNGDARPHLLVVDGFLQEVRNGLEKQGLLKTRAIIISEDGSWKPKPEVREGVADHDDDDTPVRTSMQSASGQQKPPVSQTVEVIDLGDSDDD
ncbi:uncharacterized protein CC84DRAFT_1154213 [Paraphaeosphaeria sporulosa]|uniref:SP-RING-type domain-containing protein n=1 Tax=Paraphaeosphaeria sporulosa TaxID=1460663 RepID=A0A177BZB6_9PLEO|nr:uncharacterized protein CC84DRAFT_1154213 [Paraphaeosphaeria sporulosa]OAG00874.1 hypothetical protein CC84DRAFT_1154213 [Paraphaeosphaeria sporulosa]